MNISPNLINISSLKKTSKTQRNTKLDRLLAWQIGYKLPLSQTTNFRHFQNERVCRRQLFRFVGNRREVSKQVENTVGKGEIARYEQFLLFPQCFQKTCTADT